MKQIEKNKDKWWKREKKQWKYIEYDNVLLLLLLKF